MIKRMAAILSNRPPKRVAYCGVKGLGIEHT